MTNTASPDFVTGWMMCANGDELPADASEEMKDGYGRCYETEQVKTHLSEQGVRL